MKKVLIVLLITVAVSNVRAEPIDSTKSEARKERKSERTALNKLKGDEVSYFAKDQFAEDFKDAQNVEWSRNDNFDVASFTINNKHKEAYYDGDAQLVGTITVSAFSKLPASAQQYITKHYNGYNVQRVIYYDDNEDNPTDMVLYATPFDNDSYFVELSNGSEQIVLHVLKTGEVDLFKKLS